MKNKTFLPKTLIWRNCKETKSISAGFIYLTLFIPFIFAGTVMAYNWSWDQNHDCTIVNGDTGHYDYSGAWVPGACCKCKLCEVGALNGMFFESATDISLPGNGPQLSVERSWNSKDRINGLLGRGWTFNLGRNLICIAGNDGFEYIIIRRSNGQDIRLKREGNSYEFTTTMQYDFAVEKEGNGWKLIENSGNVYEYNQDGKIIKITDKNGLSIVLSYNAQGCLSRATNASNNYLDFTLNPNGKISSITDNLGRTVEYAYDGQNNLLQINYWDGSVVKYTFDGQNMLTSISNRRGQVIKTVVYDQNQRAIQFTEKGETFTLQFDRVNKKSTKTDSHGRTWQKIMDENGIIIHEVDPLGYIMEREPNDYASSRGMNWEKDANGNRTNFVYSTSGDMTSKTDPLGKTEFWSYNNNHQVTSYTDALGAITRYEYDAQGNMTKKTEAAGTSDQRIWNYTYNVKGNLLSDINPLGATTTYTYDTLGNKIKQIGPMGETIIWTYDSIGQMKTMTDPLGNTWTYTYDGRGNLISETDPLNNSIVRQYDVDNNLTSKTDARGAMTQFVYDAWNRLIMRIGPMQDTTIQQWITIGDENLLSGVCDAMHHWTYYQYDNAGRKITEIVKIGDTLSAPDANDLITSFSVDAVGNVLKITNPEGDTSGFIYDAANHRIRQCNGMGECTQAAFDDAGRISQITQPNGNIIQYLYNSLGQVIRILDNLGILNEKKYDQTGNVIWDRMPGKGAMMYEYDLSGRVIHQMDSTGVGNRYTYDAAGRVKTSIDSLHHTTERGYDVLGRLIWTRNALGDTIKNKYDANGNQTTLIDPDGNTTNFYFDAVGRTIATKYADNGIDSTNYDKVGHVTTKKDAQQIVTTFFYDDAGRLLRKTYSDGTTPEDDYTYDKDGRMLTANNSVAQLTWQYDKASRPTHYQQVVDNATDVLKYSYDVARGVSSLTFPDGKVVQKKMDLRNRLDSVVVNGNLVAADYDYIGMAISQKKLGNGIVANYGYDMAGRLTQLAYTGSSGVLPNLSYGYDMAGNMRFALKNHQTDMSETYEYDAISQLTQWRRGTINLIDTVVHSPNYYQGWMLDKRGNWNRFDDNGIEQTRMHNEANELIKLNGISLTYDKNGNLTSDGEKGYAWNADNQITSDNVNHFIYDPLQRIIRKDNVNGIKTRYILDRWQIVMEIDANANSKIFINNEYDNSPICFINQNSVYYYLSDNLNSIISIIDKDGVEIEKYQYLPYGRRSIFQGNSEIKASLINNEIGFMGRMHESDTLIKLNDDFYSSSFGRYLQITSDGISLNRYRAFNNQPTVNIDYLLIYIAANVRKFIPGEKPTIIENTSTANTIICDGKGNYKVRLGPSKGAPYGEEECATKHESQHVADWTNRWPDGCKGVKEGYLPIGGKDYNTFLNNSECAAYKIGKSCREQKQKECDKLKCDAEKKKCKDYLQPFLDRDNAQLKSRGCK